MQLKGLKVTEDVPGFPKWSTPPTISCNCVPSCTEMSYTNKVRVDKRLVFLKACKCVYTYILFLFSLFQSPRTELILILSLEPLKEVKN